MKLIRNNYIPFRKKNHALFFVFFAMLFTCFVQGQVVNVTATDDIASEVLNDEGTVEFTRDNLGLVPLNINYQVTGTATGGTDYDLLSGTITIAAGDTQVELIIANIVDDNLVEGDETVIVTITASADYTIGVNNTATVTIADDDMCNNTPNAPQQDLGIPTEFCDLVNQDLNAYDSGVPPAGTVLVWSTSADQFSDGDYLPSSVVTGAGTYYGFYYDEDNTCASPVLQIDIVVNISPTVTGTTPGSVCDTGIVTLGATASGAATLNWYNVPAGGISLGTGASFDTPSIATTTSYYVEATENGCVSARTEVIATVNASPTVTGTTPNARCDAGVVTLGATASSITATLNWYDLPTGGTLLGSGTSFDTPIIAATTSYYVEATENGCVSARTEVVATVNASPTITATTPNARCDTGIVTLGATASGAATLNWYNVPAGGTSLGTGTSFDTPSIATTTSYYVEATENGCVSARTEVVATVTSPTVTGTTPNAICDAGIVTLGATASGTGTLNWYDLPTGGTLLGSGTSFDTPNIAATTSYYVEATENGCVSARTEVVATVTSPTVTGTTPNAICDAGIVTLGATASGTGTLSWYDLPAGGTLLGSGTSFDTPNIAATTSYYVEATENGCVSARTEVIATVNASPTITGTTPNARCDTGIVTLGATASGAATLNWYDLPTGGTLLGSGTSFDTPNIAATTSYYVEATENGCVSARTEVVATVNASPTITATTPNAICNTGVVTLGATASGAATLNWYDLPTGGTLLGSGTSFDTPSIATTTSYYVEATENGCVSARTEVIATVNIQPSSGVGTDTPACSVIGSGQTSIDLDDQLSGQDIGVWSIASQPVTSTVIIDSDNVVNFVGQTSGDYQFTYSTTGFQAPCVVETTTITIAVTTCFIDTDSDGISDADELNNGSDPLDPCDPNLTPACNPSDIDLSIVKTVDKSDVFKGEEVVFTITVTNLTTDRVIDVVVSDLISVNNGFQYVSHVASTGIYNNTNGNWSISEFLDSAQHTLEITAFPLDSGTYTNEAQITDTFPNDNNVLNDQSSVAVSVKEIDLSLNKEVDDTDAGPGEQVIFTITLTNENEAVVRDVEVEDLLDTNSGFQYVSHVASIGTYTNGNGLWEIAEVLGNEEHTLTITAVVLASGSFINTATLVSSFPLDDFNINNNVATAAIASSNICSNTPNPPQQVNSVPTVFCDVVNQDLNEYVTETPPAGTVLIWSRSSDQFSDNDYLNSSIVFTPGEYYGFYFDENNACASPVLQIDIVVNVSPTIIDTTPSAICGEGTVILNAQASAGATINWYNVPTGGTILGVGENFETPVLTQTTSYYVEAIANGCVTERVEVIATVNTQPSSGVGTDTQACSLSGLGRITSIDLDDQLTGQDVGVWSIASQPATSTIAIDANNVVDFIGQPSGNYQFTYSTTGFQGICIQETTTITIAITTCIVDTDGDGIEDHEEVFIGTDPNNPDSDGDGIDDLTEVGDDYNNPLDEDADGIIDALDSDVMDSDQDGVVDQKDPANDDPCVPDNTHGLCDTDGDGITDGDELDNGSDPLDPCDPNLTPACNPSDIDLAVVKTVDKPDVFLGEEVVFTITVSNLTMDKVIDVVVADLIEASSGFQHVSHIASTGTYDATTGNWDISEILATEQHTLEITALVLDTGTYINEAEITNTFPTDDNSSNDTSSVTVSITQIDLSVLKEVDKPTAVIGEQVVFTITLTNENEAVVSDVEVEDLIEASSGFQYVSHVASIGTYSITDGLWEIAEVLGNEEHTLTITAVVLEDGDYENTATLKSSLPIDDFNTENNTDTVTVNVSPRSTDECGFLFNQFSPNGDGVNDNLRINCINNYPNNVLTIFNRYGSEVYRKVNYDNKWNGTWKNGNLPKGTYYYVLDLADESEIRKGWIQIIR